MLILGIQQIKAYEPGDADWGVRLGDVRGQIEAKQEITRVVSLWQSGEEFVKAGGKRERGVLFLGAPGTGKTMLSKAIATSFNCPFVTIPGSGFAQSFIGMDAVLVRWLAWKARGWPPSGAASASCSSTRSTPSGGAARRSAQASRRARAERARPLLLRPQRRAHARGRPRAGDRRVARAAVRARAEPPRPPTPRSTSGRTTRSRNMIPMMGGQGGGLALNQLLVVMDGIDEPPPMRKCFTRKCNTFLDALYFVPQRMWRLRLRRSRRSPRPEQIYFIGACNVALEVLDPALTRPGRMGRHIYFRTPTWEDRRDIFDLYLGKVAHDEELDTPRQARRAGAHHQRLLAGDDRPGLLARAHVRARGRARALQPDGPGRGDDDGRGGRRDRPALPEARGAGDGDPRGRPRRLRPRVHGEPALDPAVDPQARLVRRPPPGDGDRGPVRPLALGGGRRPDLEPRRDGRRARLLRPEHDRRDRRRRLGDRRARR